MYKCTNSWFACPHFKDNPIFNAIGGKFGNKQTYKQAVKWRQAKSPSRMTMLTGTDIEGECDYLFSAHYHAWYDVSNDGSGDPRLPLGGVPDTAKTETTYSLYGGLQDSGDFFGFRAIDDGGEDEGFSPDIDDSGTDDGFSPDIGTYDKAHIPTTSSTSDCSTSSSGGVDYVPSMIDNRTVHTLPPAMFGLGKLSSACEEGDQVDRREAYH